MNHMHTFFFKLTPSVYLNIRAFKTYNQKHCSEVASENADGRPCVFRSYFSTNAFELLLGSLHTASLHFAKTEMARALMPGHDNTCDNE